MCKKPLLLPKHRRKILKHGLKECFDNILNELEFAKISDVSNPDRQKGWSCKPIQHRDKFSKMELSLYDFNPKH
jgi:hypothetical protein